MVAWTSWRDDGLKEMSVYLLEVETRIVDELRRKIAIWMVMPFPEIDQMEGCGTEKCEMRKWRERQAPDLTEAYPVMWFLPICLVFQPPLLHILPEGPTQKSSTVGTWCFFAHLLSLPAFPLPIPSPSCHFQQRYSLTSKTRRE